MWIHYSIALEVFLSMGFNGGEGLLLLIVKGSDPVTSDSESSDVEHYIEEVTIFYGDVEIYYWGQGSGLRG